MRGIFLVGKYFSCPSELLLISNFPVLFCVYTFAHTYMYIGLDLYLMRAVILLLGGKRGETEVDFDCCYNFNLTMWIVI